MVSKLDLTRSATGLEHATGNSLMESFQESIALVLESICLDTRSKSREGSMIAT